MRHDHYLACLNEIEIENVSEESESVIESAIESENERSEKKKNDCESEMSVVVDACEMMMMMMMMMNGDDTFFHWVNDRDGGGGGHHGKVMLMMKKTMTMKSMMMKMKMMMMMTHVSHDVVRGEVLLLEQLPPCPCWQCVDVNENGSVTATVFYYYCCDYC